MPSITASSSKSAGASKPYDRPATTSKGKGKGKAIAGPATSIGAPAQHGQTSRKGKKAWRKNVDITNEEVALEQAREEERHTGGKVADTANENLFVVDTVGDVQVAQRLRRAPKPLRSLAVLNERSAIPSLSSRTTESAAKRRTKTISKAEKDRLRRALHQKVAPDSTDASEPSKSVVNQDAWVSPAAAVLPGGFGEEAVVKRAPKAPITLARQHTTYLESTVQGGRGAELPDEGTSYNPSVEAHNRLIELALAEEREAIRREEEEAERIRILGAAVHARRQKIEGVEYAAGMQVGPGEVDVDEDAEEEAVEAVAKKMKKRKTQAQRNRAARQKELLHLANLEATQKKLLKSIMSVGSVQASIEKRQKELAEAERLAKLARKERERLGLVGGEKVGKYRVGKGRVTVQLGEDLAESLRQVKPEGNLFKDRFLALQKKALIEPRVPVLPRHRNRTKEYEKHAYKRFV